MMGIKPGDRILTVAASGTHAISKLLADPEEVVAVDISAPQLHMSKLQATGFKLLSRKDFCALIGINRMLVPSTERIRLYQYIRSALGSDSKEFWDRSIKDIEDGILYCGEADRALVKSFVASFPTAQDKAMIKEFLSLGDDMKRQLTFYSGMRSTSQWMSAFKSLMQSDYISSIVSNVLEDDMKIDEMFQNMFDRMVNNIPNNKNVVLEPLLTGDTDETCRLPAYLREGNYEFIQERMDRVKWIEGDLVEYIMDYASKPDLRKFDV